MKNFKKDIRIKDKIVCFYIGGGIFLWKVVGGNDLY